MVADNRKVRAFSPPTANGSLVITQDGRVIGSELIAGVRARALLLAPTERSGYNAAGVGGSDPSPTNPALTERAKATMADYRNVPADNPIPPDLVTPSGSELAPDISLWGGALYRCAGRREPGAAAGLSMRANSSPAEPSSSSIAACVRRLSSLVLRRASATT